MKIFKLIIFSLLLFVLIVPLSISAFIGAKNSPPHVQEFIDSGYNSTTDFYYEWCPENEWGYAWIKELPKDEDRFFKCIEQMNEAVGLNSFVKMISLVATIVLSTILIVYLVFYIRWLRKNYF